MPLDQTNWGSFTASKPPAIQTNMANLHLSNIHKSYDKTEATAGLTLTINLAASF